MIRRISRRNLFFLTLFILLALALPLPYVIVEPGAPTNTFGNVGDVTGTTSQAKGKAVLEIIGKKNFPTTGKLNLTSIWVTNPNSHIQGFELIRAWVDGERSVQPREVFYPKGEDPEVVNKESIADMKNSQLAAQIASFTYLRIPYTEKLLVHDFTKDSPNKNQLMKNDVLISFGGTEITSSTQLRKLIESSNSSQVQVEVERSGKRIKLPVTLTKTHVKSGVSGKNQSKNKIGVLINEKYNFPYQVKIRLKDVGGPSAGLIFTLSIIDKLTAEDLVRGRNIAGTGTIAPDGKVGPIGGIEEKLIGAAREGATLFLAPSLNCPDIRHKPKGLRVVPVDNLKEAIAALRERDLERLPMCG